MTFLCVSCLQLGAPAGVRLLFEMISDGVEPDSITYNSLINTVRPVLGLRCTNDLHIRHAPPRRIASRTLSHLTRPCLCATQCIVPDHLGLANFFLAFQSSAGVNCQADSFNVTLKSCILANDIGAAMDILNDMEVAASSRPIFTFISFSRDDCLELPGGGRHVSAVNVLAFR